MAWSACQLLYHGRRPRVCGDLMVVNFNKRYMMEPISIDPHLMAHLDSYAEAELLRLLDMIGLSYPVHTIICGEGFSLNSDAQRGLFRANLYACASPNLNRVEFVGFDSLNFKQVQGNKAWLTEDTLAFLGWRFGIRENCVTDYTIANAKIPDEHGSGELRSTTSIRASSATNFSSHGLLYVLVIFLDIMLLSSHFHSISELLKWMQHSPYYRLQLWLRQFDGGSDERIEKLPSLPGRLFTQSLSHKLSNVESIATRNDRVELDERALYAFFSTSVYRSTRYRLMIVASRLLSWVVIMPNSVIWTWSDSKNMKLQAYLSSIKSWVLVASTFTWTWRVFVKFNERLAYRISRRAHVTNQEIIAIASLVAFWKRDYIFTICEKKWHLENQRVNDVESFHGGYLAHGNAFYANLEFQTTTPLSVAWIIYAPLLVIIFWSVLMIFVWIFVKIFAGMLLRLIVGSNRRNQLSDAPYKRLALEEALDSPIRALSIVRFQLSMEMVKDGKMYIRPSCYLDYGIMLKTVEYRKIVQMEDIFQFKERMKRGMSYKQ